MRRTSRGSSELHLPDAEAPACASKESVELDADDAEASDGEPPAEPVDPPRCRSSRTSIGTTSCDFIASTLKV